MIDYASFPVPSLVDDIRRYLEEGRQPERCLARILQNDLVGTLAFADHDLESELWDVVRWLLTEMPHASWGSVDNYLHVIENGGYLPLMSERGAA